MPRPPIYGLDTAKCYKQKGNNKSLARASKDIIYFTFSCKTQCNLLIKKYIFYFAKYKFIQNICSQFPVI